MSDEERELVPSEPTEAPSPTDISPEEADRGYACCRNRRGDARPAPGGDRGATHAWRRVGAGCWLGGRHRSAHPAGGPGSAGASVPPPPLPPLTLEAIADTSEVSGDDKLLAALAWFTMVIFQLPILSIVLLLIEPNRNRPFQRYHAVTSIAFWMRRLALRDRGWGWRWGCSHAGDAGPRSLSA